MAIVGNNSHLYAKQEVPEIEAKKFPNENNAIFTLVSSKFKGGINELFVCIGKKFLKHDLSMTKWKWKLMQRLIQLIKRLDLREFI